MERKNSKFFDGRGNLKEEMKSRTDDRGTGESSLNTYRWKVDDIVEGIILSRESKVGRYGPYDVVVIKDEERGLVVVAIGPKVLKTAFERQNIVVGDYVGIKYEGLKVGNSGTEYKDFTIVSDKPE